MTLAERLPALFGGRIRRWSFGSDDHVATDRTL